MYIQYYKRQKAGVTYKTAYIAQSYRENGKVKRKHLCNLSELPDELVWAIEQDVKTFQNNNICLKDFKTYQGTSCGALIAFSQLAQQMGITKALGSSKQAKFAILQIIARIVVQESRRYVANEWSRTQAIEEVLGLTSVTEDHLYENLDWLSENQASIEDKLFANRHPKVKVESLYLYDVTSTYLEGTKNELADFGYNRDGKKGKMQIVIGLLCDDQGFPISIEVFKGNTQDSTTVASQLKKLSTRFGIKNAIIVGDRGMIKQKAIEEIDEINWYYITAITKVQIETLLKRNCFQIELFTDQLTEVEIEGIRYVLHRNPVRAKEIEANRHEKIETITKLIEKQNEYLITHKKAKAIVAFDKINEKIKHLKISNWTKISLDQRFISLVIDDTIKAKEQELDGCYVLKTNVSEKTADTQTVNARYKDLQLVEQAFRTCKQSIEEIRPVYVRKESRTKGHVFVCMLAYMLIKQMHQLCEELGFTRKYIIDQLNHMQYIGYKENNVIVKLIPEELNEDIKQIITKMNIKLPTYL